MHFGASGSDRRPCDAVVLVSWVLFTCKWPLSHPFSSLNPAPSGSATSQEEFSRGSWFCGLLLIFVAQKTSRVILIRQDSRLGDYKPASPARRSFCSASIPTATHRSKLVTTQKT